MITISRLIIDDFRTQLLTTFDDIANKWVVVVHGAEYIDYQKTPRETKFNKFENGMSQDHTMRAPYIISTSTNMVPKVQTSYPSFMHERKPHNGDYVRVENDSDTLSSLALYSFVVLGVLFGIFTLLKIVGAIILS